MLGYLIHGILCTVVIWDALVGPDMDTDTLTSIMSGGYRQSGILLFVLKDPLSVFIQVDMHQPAPCPEDYDTPGSFCQS